MAFKRIKDWVTSITAFRSGDVIPVDGPSGTAKMSKDSLLRETAQNALAGNVAPAFDPTRTSENPYKAWKDIVVYAGVTYLFTADHYGTWDASHVVLFDKLVDKFRKLDNDVGVYDIGTTYNTLDPTYTRSMAVFPIKDVNSNFVYKITNKSTNGNVIIRITKGVSPYGADFLEQVAVVGSAATEGSGEFTISADYKSQAKYIIVMNGTSGLLVSFTLELISKDSLAYKEKKDVDAVNAIVSTESGRLDNIDASSNYVFSHYEQGGFNASGEKAWSNKIVRTKYLVPIDSLQQIKLTTSDVLYVQVYSYDSNKNYLGRDGLGKDSFVRGRDYIKSLRGASYIYVGIYKADDTAMTPEQFLALDYVKIALTSLNAINSMNQNTNTDFSLLLKTAGTTPMATWIDDDGVVTHTNGGISGVVVPVAEEVGIPVTFAVIPPLSDSVVVSGVAMTRGEYFNALQKKGHQIVSHPEHTYWYGTNYNLDKVKETLIESLQDLQEYKMLHSDMMVYPGSSVTISDVVEQVRKWCVCGVRSGYGTPNHLGDSTKWDIKRTFINFADYYSLHSSDPDFVSSMAWYKSQVDAAFASGDWIVFGTHSYQFTTSEDTTDPNANTLGNLKELMQYAVTKGLKFRTLWDAYNRRKFLFEFNEINQ